jgi:hypothetical protein
MEMTLELVGMVKACVWGALVVVAFVAWIARWPR